MAMFKVREKGISGLADVRVDKDKITVKFEEGGQPFNILPEDAPKNMMNGTYYVTLSPDGAKVRGIRPPKGSYICKFNRFAGKLGEPPKYHDVGYNPRWNTPAHLEYTYIFEIVDSKYKGWELVKSVWYCFKQYESTEDIAISGRGSRTTEELLEALGVDLVEAPITYSDNVLPDLQKVILDKGGKVLISLGDGGWVDTIAAMPRE